jgi:small GTP-binding protein
VKQLIDIINKDKFPYLQKILLENKLDLENQKQITGFEVKEFLDNNTSIQHEKFSLKDNDSIEGLASKIYKAVNNSNADLPINKVNTSMKELTRLDSYESQFSFILIGDTQVGKTNFVSRYINNKFQISLTSTIGIGREIKAVKIDNILYKLTIWDTAGQERFKSLPIKYYKNVDGVLLLYDVCNESSFENVQNWLKDVKQNSNRTKENGEPDISLFLIGNKIDKEDRVISKEKGEELAKSLGMKYFEISCKLNMNLHEIMARMLIECYKRVNKNTSGNIQISSTGNNKGKKNGCC